MTEQPSRSERKVYRTDIRTRKPPILTMGETKPIKDGAADALFDNDRPAVRSE
jgi:hypothetical protein